MRAMVLERPGEPLRLVQLPRPVPGPGDVAVDIAACGVCRTDLHIVDGELTEAKLPIVPGHEIVGRVAAVGAGVAGFSVGDRVGVPWLGRTCRTCRYCRGAMENLCDRPGFTGYTRDGGYAETCVADARYVFPLPAGPADAVIAPWLCAGLIGYRALRLTGDAALLGLYGFGAAAHLAAQVARFEGRRIFAFTRPGDHDAQAFARAVGVEWAGDATAAPPSELDAAIIFAPVGALVPQALRVVRKGGTVVCGGIHMSAIPSFPYELLWGERCVRSVANLTRADGEAFLRVAPRAGVHATVETMPLEQANVALERLRTGQLTGALVLVP